MEFDPLFLSRIQFAANITFHILFPSFTIALSWILLFFKLKAKSVSHEEGRYWDGAYRLWVKIFALTFAIGVVSGVTMSFQFGANWPGYMDKIGAIAGPLLGYEVLTAFFLEATFLGVMLFGEGRVSSRVHTISTLFVALGTTFSAFWIISLNSWMQTPAGFEMVDGRVVVTDWWAAIFSPSMPVRLVHMLAASGLTAAFIVAGISAHQMLKGNNSKSVKHALNTGVITAAILIPIQIFVGDMSGLLVLKHQPDKLAAIEAIWENEKGAALNLVAIPNEKARKNDFEISVPKLGSIILTHSLDGEIKGLNSFKEHPPVAATFWSFRIMAGLGFLMLIISWWVGFKIIRKKELGRLHLKALSLMTFSGWIAVEAGWYVTEVGRQPWIVYNLIKTKDVVANHSTGTMWTSFVLYMAVYVFLFISYIALVYFMANKSNSNKSAQNA